MFILHMHFVEVVVAPLEGVAIASCAALRYIAIDFPPRTAIGAKMYQAELA